MSGHFSVTFAPHIQDSRRLTTIYYTTIVALLPAVLVGFYYYGIRAMIIVALSVISAAATEAIIEKITKQQLTISDGHAVLTGLLLAAILPVGVPWWAVIIGSAMAIALGKMVFGGLGGNPFNAVIVGWVVMRLSWPEAVSTFYGPSPLFEGWGRLFSLDASEMPLGLLKYGDQGGVTEFYGIGSALIGGIPGGVGSTSVIALALGGLYLVYRRIVPWHIPAGFLGGLLVFGLIFWLVGGADSGYANPLHHLVFGYTVIGAFFLATDQSTSPYTEIGGLVFGVGAGVLTMIIRYWGAYQDGVLFAILFLNALTPVLDRLRVKSYGMVKSA